MIGSMRYCRAGSNSSTLMQEMRLVFKKLHKYLGKNLKHLVEREDDTYVFRLHRKRVYYMREDLMRKATGVKRKRLIHLGHLVGKFTHSNRFHVTVPCIDLLSKYALNKVRQKPNLLTIIKGADDCFLLLYSFSLQSDGNCLC